MEKQKRPSAKVEQEIFGFIDSCDPIPGSWKVFAFSILYEAEEEFTIVPRRIMDSMKVAVKNMRKSVLEMYGG